MLFRASANKISTVTVVPLSSFSEEGNEEGTQRVVPTTGALPSAVMVPEAPAVPTEISSVGSS